jgi:hypothetical protein
MDCPGLSSTPAKNALRTHLCAGWTTQTSLATNCSFRVGLATFVLVILNLANKQLSYDPASLLADQRTKRHIRASKFEAARKESRLWKKVKADLGL